MSFTKLEIATRRTCALAAIVFLTLPGCATAMSPSAPDEATAIKIACEHAQARTHAATCGFTSASLKGDVWYVRAPMTCPKPMSCVGGDDYILVSKRTGRVIKIIVGE